MFINYIKVQQRKEILLYGAFLSLPDIVILFVPVFSFCS